MKSNIYHETSKATYFDNGDGSLTVQYRCANLVGKGTATVRRVKNDAQGWNYINNTLKPIVAATLGNEKFRLRYHYRCPNDGRGYDISPNKGVGFYSRRGSVTKNRGLVIDVRLGR
jgi:hypothetical protein